MRDGSGASERPRRRACCSRRRHCSLRSGYSRSLTASNLQLQHPGPDPGRRHRAPLRAPGARSILLLPPQDPSTPWRAPRRPSPTGVRPPGPLGAASCSAPGTLSTSVQPPSCASPASKRQSWPWGWSRCRALPQFPYPQTLGAEQGPCTLGLRTPGPRSALPSFTFPRSAPPCLAGLPDWHPIK